MTTKGLQVNADQRDTAGLPPLVTPGGGPVYPVAVGGVGGSGTRLIAQLLLDLGYYLGGDLNESLDNLWFTLVFKRREVLDLDAAGFAEALGLFLARMTGRAPPTPRQLALAQALAQADRGEHPPDWLRARADSLARAPAAPPGPWGWKEPNTHIVIAPLAAALPGLRYIHVVRNGLDMAHSANQNQLRFWGERLLGPGVEPSPRTALRYWHLVHRRLLERCAPLGPRFLLLDYDRLCRAPQAGIGALAAFLGLSLAPGRLEGLVARVRPPASLGRFKQYGLQVFDPQDVAFAASLGFDTRID